MHLNGSAGNAERLCKSQSTTMSARSGLQDTSHSTVLDLQTVAVLDVYC